MTGAHLGCTTLWSAPAERSGAALLLIQSRPLARSGLALRSPAHSIYFAKHALGGAAKIHPGSGALPKKFFALNQ